MKQISTFSNKKDGTSLSFYMIFIITGILIGAYIAAKSTLSDSVWINQFFCVRSFSWKDSQHTLVSLLTFLIAAYFVGLFAFGHACGLALLIYRGIGIGASAGIMYIMYGRGAILPLVSVFLPRAAAAAFIAAVSVRESVRNARALLGLCTNKYDTTESCISFRLYCLRYIVLLIFSIFVSAADGAILYFYSSVCR